jgi:hypothetical protein
MPPHDDDPIGTHEPPPVEWVDDPGELPRRPRRRIFTPLTLALLGVLLVACGFIGGVLVEKGETGSSGTPGGGLAARLAALRGTGGSSAGGDSAGSSAGGFAGRFGQRGAPAAFGEVTYVEGHTLYVENLEGNTVRVTTAPDSTVTKTITSSVRGIHPGETVVVQGTTNSKGVVAARSISVGGLGRGLATLFGGGGGGSGLSGGGGVFLGGSTSAGRSAGRGEGPALFGG